MEAATVATLTNHQMIANAMVASRGEELTAAQIWERVRSAYPNFSKGSLLPNDHADGNKHPCRCARTDERIFEKRRRNLYYVR